jgi:chaperonin GroES
MIENLKPLGDKVIAQPIKEEIKTRSGIIMAQAEPEYIKATVTAVSKGRYESGKLVPISVKAGDIIMLYANRAIELEPEYIMVREHDILGVL